MRRYYFHISNGHLVVDRVGTNLSSFADAQSEALRRASRLIADGDGENWRILVTDDEDRPIARLDFSINARPRQFEGPEDLRPLRAPDLRLLSSVSQARGLKNKRPASR